MDLFQDLTEAQAQAVRHQDGPLLVLAGAGSGKTRVVTRRMAHLVQCGVKPWSILGITFTNKAAGEMSERVKQLAAEDVWVSTFHSFCARQLRRALDLEPYTREFTIFDQDDSRKMVEDVLEELKVEPKQHKPASVHAEISRLKNAMTRPEDFAASASSFRDRVIAGAFERYQARLAASNALDFDDLLLVMIRLLEERPEVLAELRRRFAYVLVDEYQDTNRAQYRLVNLLAAEHRNLHVTGDPDQSIYRWRGAELRNILDFEKDFPEAAVVRLEQNWRSTKAILKVAGALIAHNRDRKEKGLWTDNPQGLEPALVECADEEDEGIRVAEGIQQVLRDRYVPSDVAVFYRTNAQSRSLETGLRLKGIPYVIVGGVEFYQRKEVKDALAYLRLAVNPRDDVAFLRAVNTPPRGIGAKSIERVRAEAGRAGAACLEAARKLAGEEGDKRSAKAIRAFLQAVEDVRAAGGTSVEAAASAAVEKTGLRRNLADSADPKAVDRVENLDELLGAAREYDRKAGGQGTLQGFLEEVALVSDVDKWDSRSVAVSLMTLHSSKGLEFPVVFITGLEEGLLPHSLCLESEAEIEEERRLCFVGITRTMDRLSLSFARRRSSFRESMYQRPSRFLAEAGFKVEEEPARPDDLWGFKGWRYETDEGDRPAPRPRPARAGARRREVEPEDEPQGFFSDDPPFQPGDRVRHPVFGEGQVVRLTAVGGQVNVEVRFRAHGKKILRADQAPLEKI